MIGTCARISLSLAAITLIGGSLAGCSRGTVASQQPAAGVSASTTTQAPTSAPNDDNSLNSVEDDLGTADSSTTDAAGDVADADRAAATSDSP
jgi:hypothetical protein